ncbi:MAG: glycosyltransferase [Patescibacteria group bacterium]
MKRILIFSLTYYPDLVGGAEIPVKKTTDRIDPKDISFEMVTLRLNTALPKDERIGNVLVHRVGFGKKNPTPQDLVQFPLRLNKFLYPFLAFLKARALHRTQPFDGIWSVMTSYASFGALFFKLCYPNVRYLFTLNDGDPIEYLKHKARFVYPLFARLFTKADLIHAPSTYLAEFGRSMGYRGDIAFVPNALDVEEFVREYPPSELDAVREHLGKKRGDVFIITTSRLVKKNAVDDIIKSLKFLPAHISFKILGKGPDMEALQRLAREEGVDDRVTFLGHVDLREIPKYLKACDVFVRPSLSEGMGNSPIEAMAAGLPVVSTQVGGLRDSIIDPDRNTDKQPTALAVDPHDPEAIAKQVMRFLTHKEECSRIVAHAKEFAQKNYNSAAIDKAMREQVFGKLFV